MKVSILAAETEHRSNDSERSCEFFDRHFKALTIKLWPTVFSDNDIISNSTCKVQYTVLCKYLLIILTQKIFNKVNLEFD